MTDAAGAATDEQAFLQMGLDQQQYEKLEQDFKAVLESMVGEKSMQRFQNEYEKLYRALKTSYESEKRLVKRCKELNETIVGNATRVKAALRLTQEDSSTISLLKKEVDRAWKLVETAKEKEERARRIIQDLRAEIAHLTKIVEGGTSLSVSADNNVQKMIEEKDQLKKELAAKAEQFADAETAKADLAEKVNRLQTELFQKDSEFKTLKQENEQNTIKINTMLRTQEDEKGKAAALKASESSLKANIEQLKGDIDELEKRNETLQEEKANLDEVNKRGKADLNQLQTTLGKQTQEMMRMQTNNDKLNDQNSEKQMALDMATTKMNQMERDKRKVQRENVALENDKKRLTSEKMDAIGEKEQAKGYMNNLFRDFNWLKKKTDEEQAGIMKLERDRNMLKTSLIKMEKNNEENRNQLMRKEQIINTLQEQNNANKEHIQSLITSIRKIEAEKEEKTQAANKANANLMQMVEEVKLKRNLIGELKKENIEFESKLKQQQNLYEVVRSDRNLYGKNLIIANDEVIELRKKFRIAQYQIGQLKDEIDAKDQALSAEHHQYGLKAKELETLDKRHKMEQKQRAAAEGMLREKGGEITKLNGIIKEAVDEHQLTKKAYASLMAERDILGTQLIRRNDELALLYEKIKILQITLGKGEVQYNERLEDIKLLRYKISEYKCELKIEKAKASEIAKYKEEVLRLGNALQKERLQVKALSEELENPLNYHRWRQLQGTDPDTFELLLKIQTLQKRLIKKTEEVVEKDVTIQEKEKLYVELKNLLARQPGPEVAEQLSIYQQNLKQKTNQMKAMAAELNMYQAQVNEYKYEIERLTRELQEMKRKYYEQKRREAMQREAQAKLEPRQIHQNTGPQQRFTGGGFPLAI